MECILLLTMMMMIIIIIKNVLIRVTLHTKVLQGHFTQVAQNHCRSCGTKATDYSCQCQPYEEWNKNVFKRRRKVRRDGASLTSAGRLFHAREAATGNDDAAGCFRLCCIVRKTSCRVSVRCRLYTVCSQRFPMTFPLSCWSRRLATSSSSIHRTSWNTRPECSMNGESRWLWPRSLLLIYCNHFWMSAADFWWKSRYVPCGKTYCHKDHADSYRAGDNLSTSWLSMSWFILRKISSYSYETSRYLVICLCLLFWQFHCTRTPPVDSAPTTLATL